MTVKEKASELFKSYLNVGMGDGWAKQCALITIHELIRIAPWGDNPAVDEEDFSKFFYINVKQEIHNRL